MAVTTLTGTTWVLNDSLVIEDLDVEISFTSSLGDHSNFLLYQTYYNALLYAGPVNDNHQYTNSTLVYRTSSGWVNEDYRTITFTSEVNESTGQITQTEFISWLETNAVQAVRKISKIKLPDGSEYNFKDTVSGYITSAPVTSVNGQTGNVTVQSVLTAGTGITITNNVISLNVTVVDNEYGGQTITIGG